MGAGFRDGGTTHRGWGGSSRSRVGARGSAKAEGESASVRRRGHACVRLGPLFGRGDRFEGLSDAGWFAAFQVARRGGGPRPAVSGSRQVSRIRASGTARRSRGLKERTGTGEVKDGVAAVPSARDWARLSCRCGGTGSPGADGSGDGAGCDSARRAARSRHRARNRSTGRRNEG